MLSLTEREEPVTGLAKILLALTVALLLSVGIVGRARHAYAQDGDETNQSAGAWGAPNAPSADLSDQKVKAKPIDIKGCWSGTVMDTDDDLGTATFEFHQNSNHKQLRISSTFDFQWPDTAFAHGPMKGPVSSTGFNFSGNAGTDCAVVGSAMGDATALSGTVEFGGDCATLFQDVTFSITPGCM
jgi:hypothetical protein